MFGTPSRNIIHPRAHVSVKLGGENVVTFKERGDVRDGSVLGLTPVELAKLPRPAAGAAALSSSRMLALLASQLEPWRVTRGNLEDGKGDGSLHHPQVRRTIYDIVSSATTLGSDCRAILFN